MSNRRERALRVMHFVHEWTSKHGESPDATGIAAPCDVSEHFARQFLEEYGIATKFVGLADLVDHSLSPGDDPPDFVLDGRIGLEVTTYHQPPSPGALPRKLVEKAWERLQSDLWDAVADHRDITGVGVKFAFKALDVPSNAPARQAFVRETFEFVRHARMWVSDERVSFRVDVQQSPVLAQYVESVALHALDPPLKWLFWWNHNVGHGVSEKSLLASLENKLAGGRPPSVDEYWLLVATGLRVSERAELGPYPAEELNTFSAMKTALGSSSFDHVYIIEIPTARVPLLDELTSLRIPGWEPPPGRPVLKWEREADCWTQIEAS